ncbi:MAG: tRNA (uridine(34)/cytosine(34)/5-carboxymethylaminomethyluridine(34)-2'-O)-methyltransferase TrmL, partial [Gammaproteobacteria bacterium]|nr:tRNA (uridine(34)/cytosine(34)/5-carboxymethylaminomethyluridine(34)-2'-O)-methyltransferase TrmL [Gammaproteobacteria bacterium]
YHEWADVRLHASLADCLDTVRDGRLFVLSTHGERRHDEPALIPGDAFLFGPESRGLPPGLISSVPADRRLRIPMKPPGRSLNLANSVAVVVYEAWRQAGFEAGL